MEDGFVLIREFTYGPDFTEFNEKGEIVIHKSQHKAEIELADCYIQELTKVRQENLGLHEICINDLQVCFCQFDGKIVMAFNDDGSPILESTLIHHSQV
jgi:hypothetical protein